MYEQIEIRVYYLTKRNGFVYRYGDQPDPEGYDANVKANRDQATHWARTEIDSLVKYDIPETEDEWLGLFRDLMDVEDDYRVCYKDTIAFALALGKYVEWKQSLPTK